MQVNSESLLLQVIILLFNLYASPKVSIFSSQSPLIGSMYNLNMFRNQYGLELPYLIKFRFELDKIKYDSYLVLTLRRSAGPYPPQHASLGFLGIWEFLQVPQHISIPTLALWSRIGTLGKLVFERRGRIDHLPRHFGLRSNTSLC